MDILTYTLKKVLIEIQRPLKFTFPCFCPSISLISRMVFAVLSKLSLKSPTLLMLSEFQQLNYCCWSNVSPPTVDFEYSGVNDGPTYVKTLPTVIELSSLTSELIVQNLFNLFF